MGEPLWKQCLAWLRGWNMVPPGGEVTSPGELVLLLRDGVVLCQLVHCLDPTSVDMTQVVYTPHTISDAEAVSDFVCRNNIFLFLSAAIKNFCLDHDHFFQPADLYEAEDISTVLKTLSALSHSPKFLSSGKPGFPKKPGKLEKKILAEEPLYGDLRSYLAQQAAGEWRSLEVRRSDSCEGSPGGERTYSPRKESLYSPRKESLYSPRREVYSVEGDDSIYQSICSPRRSKPLLPALSKKSKREYPIKEFLDSEEKYVTNLCMVRDHFQLQLQQLRREVMMVVFFRLQELIVHHSGLLRGLQGGEKGVGEVVLEHSQGFHLYREYCTNLTRAMAALEEEEARNPKLKKELVKCQLAAKSPFPLSAHIVLPFQRFTKYHLLLSEVLKHTPPDHKEHTELGQALNYMKNLNGEVNEAKRQQEEEERLLLQDEKDMAILGNLQRTIKSMKLESNQKLQDFGRLRRAGELTLEGENTDYAFLLDSIMLVCNRPRLMQQRYRFKFSVRISDFHVDTQPPLQGSIRLLPRYPEGSSPLLLYPRSPPELDLWLRALLTCMDQLFPSQLGDSGHTVKLVRLAGLQCSHCNRHFMGCLAQGYRCQSCSSLLHKSCLAEQPCQGERVELRRSGSMALHGSTASMALPSFLERDSTSRASMGSTLSIAPGRGSPRHSQVGELQAEARRQAELLPLSQQDWWAGQIDLRTATARIQSLPTGTFLVRAGGEGGGLALDLKAETGVKHVRIYVQEGEAGGQRFSFSEARSFPTLQQLVGYYRTRDLLENFNYKHLEGVRLSLPYKSV